MLMEEDIPETLVYNTALTWLITGEDFGVLIQFTVKCDSFGNEY
jgi:hypothetical protein